MVVFDLTIWYALGHVLDVVLFVGRYSSRGGQSRVGDFGVLKLKCGAGVCGTSSVA